MALFPLHSWLNCVGLVSRQNLLLFDWIIWKQTDLSLGSPFSGKYLLNTNWDNFHSKKSLLWKENLFKCSKYLGEILQQLRSALKADICRCPCLEIHWRLLKTLKTKKKSVSSNVFWYVQVHIFWKCIQYTIYWDKKFYSAKTKRTKNALFSFSNSNLSQF